MYIYTLNKVCLYTKQKQLLHGVLLFTDFSEAILHLWIQFFNLKSGNIGPGFFPVM